MRQDTKIPFIEPVFNNNEAQKVSDYVQSGAWLTEHKQTRLLEYELAEMLGVKFCYMYPNCTLALYAAIMATEKKGQFIVPDFTMIATANAVQMAGCIPVFVDINPQTLCIDLFEIKRFDSVDNIVGVVAVDLNGRSPYYARLRGVCKKNDWILIEDSAQAFGSSQNLKPLGTFGDVGCFSFSPHKIITTGQGGCCVTDNTGIANNLKRFRNFGRAESGGYGHDTFGINLKFTDLQAVVGLAQLETIEERKHKKKTLFARYHKNLKDVVEFLPTDLIDVSPWYVDVFTDSRDELAEWLKEYGVGSQKFYPALHNTEVYDHYVFPEAERVSNCGLWLPSSVNLKDWQIDYVCDVIHRFF